MPMFCRNWPPSPKCWCIRKISQSSRLLGVLNLLVESKLLYFRPPPKKLQKAAWFFCGTLPHCQLILYPQFLLHHKPSWSAHFVIQSSRMFMNASVSWEMLSRFRDISCSLSCSSLSIYQWLMMDIYRKSMKIYVVPVQLINNLFVMIHLACMFFVISLPGQ